MNHLRAFFFFLLLCFSFSACQSGELPEQQDTLVIAYAEGLSNPSPFSYEAANRRYLSNIYESLVSYGKSFNVQTSLAVSWGRLDDTTWEFHLREGVWFHNGTDFDADDVLYSLEYARGQEDSELSSLLSTIESVKKVEDYKIQITTKTVDPLLLNRLVNVYMVPEAYDEFEIPIGTGPYRIEAVDDSTLFLERFDSYWGDRPYFEKVALRAIPDINTRIESLKSGEIQVLANVPPQFTSDLEEAGILLKDFPSLELSLLIFNHEGVFADKELRELVWNTLSTNYAEELGGGYLLPSSQYAPTGILGYAGQFEGREPDLDYARSLRAGYEDLVLNLDIPQGLEALGEVIRTDLAQLDVQLEVNVLNTADFERKILEDPADLYFFGWKYDLADSLDFFESVIHSPEGSYGQFNGFHFKDESIDALIESTGTLLDEGERQKQLVQISELLVEQKVALPLFESKLLYGVHPSVFWEVSLDGQILASEIFKNMVE